MSFGPYLLPTATKTHVELNRYVRSEYREADSGWFAASCAHETCRKIMAEEKPVGHIVSSVPEIRSSASPRPTNCPVLNAIADSRLMSELATRGELSGRE